MQHSFGNEVTEVLSNLHHYAKRPGFQVLCETLAEDLYRSKQATRQEFHTIIDRMQELGLIERRMGILYVVLTEKGHNARS